MFPLPLGIRRVFTRGIHQHHPRHDTSLSRLQPSSCSAHIPQNRRPLASTRGRRSRRCQMPRRLSWVRPRPTAATTTKSETRLNTWTARGSTQARIGTARMQNLRPQLSRHSRRMSRSSSSCRRSWHHSSTPPARGKRAVKAQARGRGNTLPFQHDGETTLEQRSTGRQHSAAGARARSHADGSVSSLFRPNDQLRKLTVSSELAG